MNTISVATTNRKEHIPITFRISTIDFLMLKPPELSYKLSGCYPWCLILA